jgi:VWFA-related protein
MTILLAWLRAAILPLGLALLLADPLLAQRNSHPTPRPQTSSAQQSSNQYTFKLSVNRVVVDVVVTDSNGKPVHGLSKQDFSLFEDGGPQNVLSFDVHSLDSNPSYFAKLPSMPPNTFVNVATEPERGPLYVLLLDLLNTEQDDQPYARKQLLKFVDSKPQGTRFAVFVLSDGLHLVQGFTADRDRLHETLDPSHSVPHVPRIFLLGANYGRGDGVTMLSAFQLIALYLEGLPGRKNIIWASGKFPLDLFAHNDDRPDTRADATETLDALTRSESAIYPVDVAGVQPFPAGRLTGATTGAGPASGPPGMVATDTHTIAAQSQIAGSVGESIYTNSTTQDVVAQMTGGRAFYGRNDVGNMLEEATEAGSDYYTLAYSPSNPNFDGKMRTIRVELANKSYRLEYRRGYLATAPQSPILPSRYQSRKQEETANLRPIGDSLAAYMQHGAPTARQVYFRAHVQALSPLQLATPAQMANLVDQPTYFRERQRKHPNKPLPPVEVQTYQVDYQVIARVPNLEVAAGAYDDEGRLLNGDVEEASSANPAAGPAASSAPSPAASDAQSNFTYFRVQQKIDVPVNTTSLRLGVRDLSTDRMGTMEIPLPLAPEPSGSTP